MTNCSICGERLVDQSPIILSKDLDDYFICTHCAARLKTIRKHASSADPQFEDDINRLVSDIDSYPDIEYPVLAYLSTFIRRARRVYKDAGLARKSGSSKGQYRRKMTNSSDLQSSQRIYKTNPQLIITIIATICVVVFVLIAYWLMSGEDHAKATTSFYANENHPAEVYSESGTTSDDTFNSTMVLHHVAAGSEFYIAIQKDGTVITAGYKFAGSTSSWGTGVVAVDAGEDFAVGLKEDGTVVNTIGASVLDSFSSGEISKWNDCIGIAAGSDFIVSLRKDGRVFLSGYIDRESKSDYASQTDISEWGDIIAVSAGKRHVLGLCPDGRVRAYGSNRNFNFDYLGQCETSDWTDIIAIDAGWFHSVGIKKDGTVVAAGDNRNGACDVYDWADVVRVAAGSDFTVGLRDDGTILATGDYPSEILGWDSIVEIDAYLHNVIGKRIDGSVVVTGDDYLISNWNVF